MSKFERSKKIEMKFKTFLESKSYQSFRGYTVNEFNLEQKLQKLEIKMKTTTLFIIYNFQRDI